MEFINSFLDALSIFISQLGGFEITVICLGILFFVANSILDSKQKEKRSSPKEKAVCRTDKENCKTSNNDIDDSEIELQTPSQQQSGSLVGSDFNVKDYLDDNPDFYKTKGRILENYVISSIMKFYPDSKILRNLILTKPSGGTSEIDVLVLNPRGIVCIECKNYECSISGGHRDKYWRAEYNENYIVDFYSPVLQNSNHIKTLNKLGIDYQISNLVVFSDKAKLSDEVFRNKFITKFGYLNKKLEYIFGKSNYEINQEELDKLCDLVLRNQTGDLDSHVSYANQLSLNS